jgi:muconolactone D-isomerase
MEYLVTMTTHVPDGTPDQAVDEIRAREAARSRELAAAGHLMRLWRPPLRPGEWRSRRSWPRCRCGCGAPMR